MTTKLNDLSFWRMNDSNSVIMEQRRKFCKGLELGYFFPTAPFEKWNGEGVIGGQNSKTSTPTDSLSQGALIFNTNEDI
eukprot:4931715-Amphidinium_carterae.2